MYLIPLLRYFNMQYDRKNVKLLTTICGLNLFYTACIYTISDIEPCLCRYCSLRLSDLDWNSRFNMTVTYLYQLQLLEALIVYKGLLLSDN